MTVSTTLDRQYFPADGFNKNFSFNFRFFDNSQIFVYVLDEQGNPTGKTLNVDYTLSGAMAAGGGTVVFSVAPAINTRVLVRRILPQTQPTSIRNQGAFFPAIHEDVFDRLTMLVQQSMADTANSLQLTISGDKWDFKGNKGINAANPTDPQDVATLQWAVEYISGILETGQGPINNAANVIYVDPEGGIRTVQEMSGTSVDKSGASLIGIRRFQTSKESNVDRILKRNSPANVFDYMTEAEVADVLSMSPVLDHTTAFQNALSNNITVEVPPFTFRVRPLVMNKFGHALVATASSGGQAYGGGAVLKGLDPNEPMIEVTKPTSYFSGLVLWGLSSDAEKGQDVAQVGIKFAGSAQKDIDAKIQNCALIYLRSCVVANGTNIEFDSVGFSNCTYGFETSNSAGWENRGFIFSPTCRFHSIGKAGTESAGVKLWPAHNVRDAVIAGVCDDSTTLFSGMASGLTIDALMVRARGNGLMIDAAGHGQPATSRMVTVKSFSYHATDATNTSMANSGVISSGLMDLTLSQVQVRGCGGHGINNSVASAKIKNSHVSDAGQFASNTYDGVISSGAGTFIQSVSTSQDVNGSPQTNKARYGINLMADTYITGISAGLGTISGPINVSLSATIFGEIPANGGPASSESWASAVPTSGTYRAGSVVKNRAPSVLGTAPNQFIVTGWARLTTGSAHVLGTDWVAMRTLTGS